MSEKSIVERIDEHLAGNQDFYGVEFGNEELKIIRASLAKQIPEAPTMKPFEGFSAEEASALSCPTCGNPVCNYWAPGNNPKHCQFCGQKLKWRSGEEAK